MNKLITATALIILATATFFVIGEGLNRHEIAECLEWQQWSEEYEGFYLAEWQKEQCDHHGIAIDAPVR